MDQNLFVMDKILCKLYNEVGKVSFASQMVMISLTSKINDIFLHNKHKMCFLKGSSVLFP